jgi:hypothetical protein
MHNSDGQAAIFCFAESASIFLVCRGIILYRAHFSLDEKDGPKKASATIGPKRFIPNVLPSSPPPSDGVYFFIYVPQ